MDENDISKVKYKVEYLNNEGNGKGKEYDIKNKRLIFEGEYKNG